MVAGQSLAQEGLSLGDIQPTGGEVGEDRGRVGLGPGRWDRRPRAGRLTQAEAVKHLDQPGARRGVGDLEVRLHVAHVPAAAQEHLEDLHVGRAQPAEPARLEVSGQLRAARGAPQAQGDQRLRAHRARGRRPMRAHPGSEHRDDEGPEPGRGCQAPGSRACPHRRVPLGRGLDGGAIGQADRGQAQGGLGLHLHVRSRAAG